VVAADAAFMTILDFLFGDDAAEAAVLRWLNCCCCCCMEPDTLFLKANDVEEVNADGGILIREVFVATIIGGEVADVALMML
jgi:hypothetical protein